MNKTQHCFVWAGIALLTFMALAFDSTIIWLIVALALIGESVYLCKDKPISDIKWFFLVLAFVIFGILFLAKSEIRDELGFSHRRPVFRSSR